MGDRFFGVAPPFFLKQWVEILRWVGLGVGTLQSADDVRLFCLGLKAVTDFHSFFPPFFLLCKHFVFLSPGLRILGGTGGYVGSRRAVTRVWKRHKGLIDLFTRNSIKFFFLKNIIITHVV